jgi:EAL domain-containing protein (putative c-di-GMP-specific phosphodiesterase class I)
VLGLGRSLEIPVVAEGVETAEQILFLRGENCTELQGYAIGRPTPLDAIGAWTMASALPSAAVLGEPVDEAKRSA